MNFSNNYSGTSSTSLVGKSEFSSGEAKSTNGMREVDNLVVSMPDIMLRRCAALHNTYRGIEWSGPAWFKCDETKLVWELVDFFVLDVGSSTFTEWDQQDLAAARVYETIYGRNGEDPEFFDKHICGNIHTHHTMRHFFSGTDSSAVFEHTPDGEIWPSIIVNEGLRSCAFGIGYKDLFGFTNLLFNNNVIFSRASNENDEELIQQEVGYIETKKKKRTYTGPSRGTQMDLYRPIVTPKVSIPKNSESGGSHIWIEIYDDIKGEIELLQSERQFNRYIREAIKKGDKDLVIDAIVHHGAIRTKFGVVTVDDLNFV